MDVVNAILLVEGSDRAGIPLRDLAAWGAVLKAMERPSQLLTSSMVYRGISALRRMGSDNSHCKKFMQLLLARVEDSAVLLHGNDICPSIYSMQSFNANMPEVRQLLSLFSKSLAMTNVPMTSKSICSALFGLKRMKAVPEVRALLLQIAKKIDTADSFYHSVNVCIGLNGLQSMDDSSPEVRAVMRALMAKAIPAHEQGLDQVTDREMSMALFGIQRMGGHQKISRGGQRSNASPELRAVMKYIASLFAFSKVDFEAKRVGLCVLGLSGLSSDTPEVRSLVSEIAVKASRAWGTMSGQEMSMCLHGLSGLRSENAEVVALLESLVHLVKSCPGFKSESEVSSALEGLQGLRSGSAVVDNFVGAVAGLLQRSALNGTLSAPHYLASLYGLQRLSTSSAEVRKLVSKLPFLLNKNGTERIDATDFSSALYGCRALNSQNEETLALVHSLTPLVAGIQGSMSALNVGSALYGLQKLRSDAREVRGLVAALAPAVASAEGVMTHKSISMALNGLQGMSSKQREVRELVNSLAGLMERAETQFTGFADFQEVSGALAGLADMSGDCAEVHRLVSSLARLLAATDMTKFRDVKGERVATALFGLQGQSSRLQPSRDIMLSLVTPLKLMTNFRGKELGMALQGFKDCAGKPPTGYDEVLAVLSTKISGWAGVEVRGRRQVRDSSPFPRLHILTYSL